MQALVLPVHSYYLMLEYSSHPNLYLKFQCYHTTESSIGEVLTAVSCLATKERIAKKAISLRHFTCLPTYLSVCLSPSLSIRVKSLS